MRNAGAPVESPVVSPRSRDHTDPGWEVMVWNDPVNTMSYVVYVFMKVLRFDRARATRHMLEVHEKGQSCVALEAREKAELYHQQILHHGLRCTLRPAG
ncbi:MAG: ATP-dependent Clp protease adaptor ClpS [Candidatus Methylacidiphilales bacterium]|nr:ATP-dependent Clp protease adaptor ClpS [Candidatus Methylacidiphilales bacterium]